jgi:protoheme IX farnesyltransferase
MIKTYYQLTKPGIIYGNTLVAAAGFLFAAKGNVDWLLFAATLVGLALIIACGCVINNVLDREIDAKMARTQKRATVTGKISETQGYIYAFLLGVAGALLLWYFTNLLTLAVALAGLFVYAGIYTPLKPKSPFALFVGAVAGAVPPVVGYVAVTNTLDWYAAIFFIFMYSWQIPHFLAIATYRYAEYKAAGVPLYITTEPTPEAKRWGKKIFGYSLVVLLVFCGILMLHR